MRRLRALSRGFLLVALGVLLARPEAAGSSPAERCVDCHENLLSSDDPCHGEPARHACFGCHALLHASHLEDGDPACVATTRAAWNACRPAGSRPPRASVRLFSGRPVDVTLEWSGTPHDQRLVGRVARVRLFEVTGTSVELLGVCTQEGTRLERLVFLRKSGGGDAGTEVVVGGAGAQRETERGPDHVPFESGRRCP